MRPSSQDAGRVQGLFAGVRERRRSGHLCKSDVGSGVHVHSACPGTLSTPRSWRSIRQRSKTKVEPGDQTSQTVDATLRSPSMLGVRDISGPQGAHFSALLRPKLQAKSSQSILISSSSDLGEVENGNFLHGPFSCR